MSQEQTIETKKKWYDHKWAVRLLLVILYPLGLYGFIRAPKKPIVTMVVFTLLWGGIWYIGITGIIEYENAPKDTIVANESVVEIAENTPDNTETRGYDLKVVENKQKDAVSGSWLETSETAINNEPLTIVFHNGMLILISADSKYNLGKYILVSDNEMNTTWVRDDYSSSLSYNLDGNILSLTDGSRTIKLEKQINATDYDNYSEYVTARKIFNRYDFWDRINIEDSGIIDDIAGEWQGSTKIFTATDSEYSDTALADAYVLVNVSAQFNKNAKTGTENFVVYSLTADYTVFLDKYIEGAAQVSKTPKFMLNGYKKEYWEKMKQSVEDMIELNKIGNFYTGDVKVKGYSMIMKTTLPFYTFEKEFADNLFMNLEKDKIRITFDNNYISYFLPNNHLEIELEKK